jgi:probable HAF family extracellular repeat protein
MKSVVMWWFNGGSRMISRAWRTHRLPSAGIACLGLALVGIGGLTTAQSQEQATADDQNTRYTIEDLGVVATNPSQPAQPILLTNNGWVAGSADVGAALHAVLWHGGERIDIGDPGLGGNSYAFGVNESGHAVGEAEDTSTELSTTEDFCGFQFYGYSSSPKPCVPFVWRAGKMVPLKTLGGVNGSASQINSWGAIAGYAENKVKDPGCPAPQIYQFKPALWFEDWVLELPIGKDSEGFAFAINDWGQVIGVSGKCAAFNPIWGVYMQLNHALLWQYGETIDLGSLGGVTNNIPHAINNRGEVVGGSDLAGDLTSHAFLWTPETKKMQDLGTLPGDVYSVALGINDKGQITGLSVNQSFTVLRAWVREKGELVDLNTLISGTTSLFLETACSINSKGEIIGFAYDKNNPNLIHGYLAVPTSD